jgi:hypothetical protein
VALCENIPYGEARLVDLELARLTNGSMIGTVPGDAETVNTVAFYAGFPCYHIMLLVLSC